jgi:hypothetical protein
LGIRSVKIVAERVFWGAEQLSAPHLGSEAPKGTQPLYRIFEHCPMRRSGTVEESRFDQHFVLLPCLVFLPSGSARDCLVKTPSRAEN